MTAHDQVLLVEGTVRLLSAKGPVALRAEQVRIEVDDDEISGVRLVGVVDPATWALVDTQPLFRLDRGLRGPGAVPIGAHVRLELALDVDQFAAIDSVDALWADLQGGGGPAAVAASWLALAARPVDVDDPFAGFVTAWAAEDQPLAGAHPRHLSPLEGRALAAFIAGGWRPTRWPGTPRQLSADDLGDQLDLVVVVQALDDDQKIAVVVRLPEQATDPLEMARTAAGLAASGYQEVEVDGGDGAVTLITALDARAGPPAPATVLGAMEATVATARGAHAATVD